MNRFINYGRGVREVFRPGDTLDFRQKFYQKPRNTSVPKIDGSGTVGAAQSFTPGLWTPAPASVTHVWQLNGRTVGTAATYTPVPADSGKMLTVLETAIATNGLAATARSPGVLVP